MKTLASSISVVVIIAVLAMSVFAVQVEDIQIFGSSSLGIFASKYSGNKYIDRIKIGQSRRSFSMGLLKCASRLMDYDRLGILRTKKSSGVKPGYFSSYISNKPTLDNADLSALDIKGLNFPCRVTHHDLYGAVIRTIDYGSNGVIVNITINGIVEADELPTHVNIYKDGVHLSRNDYDEDGNIVGYRMYAYDKSGQLKEDVYYDCRLERQDLTTLGEFNGVSIGSAVLSFMLDEYAGTSYAYNLRAKLGLTDNDLYIEAIDDYTQMVSSNYDLVSCVGAMKMWPIHPNKPGSEGEYDFTLSDYFVNFGDRNNIDVRGHTLVWANDAANSAWLRPDVSNPGQFLVDWDAPQDKEGWLSVLEDHVNTIVDRYQGRVYVYDVVNEVIGEHGFDDEDNIEYRDCIWNREIGSDYIAAAFNAAHAADPNAKLFINENNVLMPGDKADAFYQLVRELIAQGIKIDGIGMQGHIITNYGQFKGYDPASSEVREKISQNLQRFADLGLEIHITELDVRLAYEPVSRERYADIYGNLMTAFLAVENENKDGAGVTNVTFWGANDTYSTMRDRFPDQLPGVLDANGNPTASYERIKEVMIKTLESDEEGKRSFSSDLKGKISQRKIYSDGILVQEEHYDYNGDIANVIYYNDGKQKEKTSVEVELFESLVSSDIETINASQANELADKLDVINLAETKWNGTDVTQVQVMADNGSTLTMQASQNDAL